MSETSYDREVTAARVPNLTGKVETSSSQHFACLKAGELAASRTEYAGGDLSRWVTIQSSAMFGANLMVEAVKRVGLDGDLTRAMIEVVEGAGIPFPDPHQEGR
jgi:hypothetical protein